MISLSLHDDDAIPRIDIIRLYVGSLVVDGDQLRGDAILADELVGHVAGTLLRELHVVVRGIFIMLKKAFMALLLRALGVSYTAKR